MAEKKNNIIWIHSTTYQFSVSMIYSCNKNAQSKTKQCWHYSDVKNKLCGSLKKRWPKTWETCSIPSVLTIKRSFIPLDSPFNFEWLKSSSIWNVIYLFKNSVVIILCARDYIISNTIFILRKDKNIILIATTNHLSNSK